MYFLTQCCYCFCRSSRSKEKTYKRSRRAVLAGGTRESLFTLSRHKRNKEKVMNGMRPLTR